MIIMIGSQKGGCGKSTLAVNVAGYLAIERGADVLLVDADAQTSISRWAQDRQDNAVITSMGSINSVQACGDIRATLRDLGKRYDHVVVDVAGRDSKELRSGMLAADVLISPARPSQYDLDTLPHLVEVFTNSKMYNEGLRGFLVLNLCPTNPVIKEAQDARTYLVDFPEFRLAGSLIHDRKAYRDSVSDGRTVLEWRDKKAANEIRSLMNEILADG